MKTFDQFSRHLSSSTGKEVDSYSIRKGGGADYKLLNEFVLWPDCNETFYLISFWMPAPRPVVS